MRLAQVLVFEADGRLAHLLRPAIEQHGWRLRELRQSDSVLEVLKEGGPVLLLRLGRDLYEELALLEQVQWAYPDTAVVVITATDHPELTAFVWDLGATFVLVPPFSPEHLVELVCSLMPSN